MYKAFPEHKDPWMNLGTQDGFCKFRYMLYLFRSFRIFFLKLGFTNSLMNRTRWSS